MGVFLGLILTTLELDHLFQTYTADNCLTKAVLVIELGREWSTYKHPIEYIGMTPALFIRLIANLSSSFSGSKMTKIFVKM